MAGYDLDRYRDIEGVQGIQRVMEPAHVVSQPIHKEAPEEESGEKPRPQLQIDSAIIAAGPPPEEKKKAGRPRVERQMVVMNRARPKQKKPFTMADIKT